MVRGGNQPILLAAVCAVLISGCSIFESDVRQTPVTIYGHNAGAPDAWIGLLPLSDPPQAVGFGADGVGCLHGPVGSEVASFDGLPGQGGQPAKRIGIVAVEDGSGPNVFWVSVAADGTLTNGRGVPAWWVGDAQAC